MLYKKTHFFHFIVHLLKIQAWTQKYPMSSIKIPKNQSKNALFDPDFRLFFASKPLHVVVRVPYLPFKPLFVIRTILSTWLELPLLMSAFLGTGQPFFRAFAVCGNISTVLRFSETYQRHFQHYR